LFFNLEYRQYSPSENKQTEVHADREWTILCLLDGRSLGGNLRLGKQKEWLHAFFRSKKTMKRKILFLLLPLISLMAMANEPITKLVIWAKDGTKVAYALVEKPKITFTEREMVVNTNNIEVNYDLESLLRFTYGNEVTTNITDLKSDDTFRFRDEALVFPALSANSTISVYSLNGSLVFKKTVPTAGEYAFPLSNLNAGMYLVKVNGLTYKIIKR